MPQPHAAAPPARSAVLPLLGKAAPASCQCERLYPCDCDAMQIAVGSTEQANCHLSSRPPAWHQARQICNNNTHWLPDLN